MLYILNQKNDDWAFTKMFYVPLHENVKGNLVIGSSVLHNNHKALLSRLYISKEIIFLGETKRLFGYMDQFWFGQRIKFPLLSDAIDFVVSCLLRGENVYFNLDNDNLSESRLNYIIQSINDKL